MMSNTKQVVVPLILALALVGCASPTSDRYNARDVGQIIETVEGTVVSSRVVDVQGENKGYGTLAGGAAGGATGIAVSGGGSLGLLAAVIGALVGAGTGYLIEDEARDREGIEYVIRMNDGRVVTLVQNRADEEEPLADGTPVLIQYGQEYTRVTGLPEDVQGTVGGGAAAPTTWQNPDETAPGQEPLTEVEASEFEASESQ